MNIPLGSFPEGMRHQKLKIDGKHGKWNLMQKNAMYWK